MNEKTTERFEFIINILYFTIIGAIIFILFKYGITLLLPFILAIAIVAMIQPIVRYIERKIKFKKKSINVVVLALVYVIVGLLIFWAISELVRYSFQGVMLLPGFFRDTLIPMFEDFIAWGNKYIELPQVTALLETINESLIKWLQDIAVTISQKGVGIATSFTKNIASYFITFLFMVMLSFSINLQYDEVIAFIKEQLPTSAKEIISNTKRIFSNVFGKYIKSFIILMFITFAELVIGLFIIGTDNVIIIAAGIAILDALPIFGTGTVLIPWVIIELFQQNFTYALGLAVIYIVITLIRRVLEPKVVGKQLGMNPVVSLLSIYLGYRIFGVFGMIFAPILVQIIVELNNDGVIHLYKPIRSKDTPSE